MKFSNSLLLPLLIISALSACGLTQEKPVKQKLIEKEVSADVTANNSAAANVASTSSILPIGPVTPNPYLLSPQKFSEVIEVNFRAAVAAMQQKNWNSAESTLKQLLEKNPKLSGVHLNLGIVYRNKGELEKAAEEFNRAISANIKNVDAYNQLAVLKREAGDFVAAENLYKKALGVWPFYPEGHKNIAILYDLYLGDSVRALQHYQAYQQLLPSQDKQIDSWVADLQRRLATAKSSETTEAK